MSENSKDNKEVTSSFTVDSEDTMAGEMPSVTRLLNRKTFTKSIASITGSQKLSTPTKGAPASEPPAAAGPLPSEDGPTLAMPAVEPPVTPVTPSPAAASITSAVSRAAKRRATGIVRPLHAWQPASLREGSDPLGQALASLIDSGVSQVLFLSIQPVPGKTPVFVAAAAVNAGPKQSVWTGLSWDPSLLPGIWAQLVSVGFVELPPPGTMTNLHSERNVSRAAFDVASEEGLYIVRVGTPKQCRGLAALITRKSLTAAIKQILPVLSAAPPAAPVKKPA